MYIPQGGDDISYISFVALKMMLSPQLADEEKDTARNCQICGKHFNTQNAFDNHIQSKKHKEMEAKQEKKLAQRVKQLNAKNAEKGLGETDIRDKDTVNTALKERLQGQRSREGDDVDMDSEDGKYYLSFIILMNIIKVF